MNIPSTTTKKKDKKETDDTCKIRGRSRFGGSTQELLPDLQPLVSGWDHALCERLAVLCV